MTTLFEGEGLQKQARKVEAIASTIIALLSNRYGVPVPQRAVVWDKGDFQPVDAYARVECNNLYLNWTRLVAVPYDKARRDAPVTLELTTPDGKMQLTFPFHKILDWLTPAPQIQRTFGTQERTPITDTEMRWGITRAIVSQALNQESGWLAADQSNARCLRNGIISSYEHLVAGTMPTQVSERIWDTDDPGLERWRESEGGFIVLYPYMKNFLFTEVLDSLRCASPPNRGEKLPDYIPRILDSI